jgi:very-short-patch-repair endonuclease
MAKPFILYNQKLKKFSKELRNNSTLSEVLLWKELKAGKMKGYKFNRQKPLNKYVADFYCKKINLIIEIDGYTHNDKYQKDLKRQKELEELGMKFIRFDDLEIKFDLLNVLRKIENFIVELEKSPS